jgi:acetyl esterase/lipase
VKLPLAALFAAALFAQPRVPDSVLLERGIEYSRVGEPQLLDIARPKSAQGRLPAVVAIHGGGFRAGKRDSYLPLILGLAERGYVAATVDYRLSPKHQFPAAVEDVKASVRWMRANAGRYGIDPDRIGAIGGSAGGHLVLMLGLTAGVAEFEGTGPNREFSSKVQCVVDYYGPSDFTKSYGASVDAAEVLPMWLGGDLSSQEKLHRRASPLNWVSPNAAPILAIHGTEDKYVAHDQSVWLTDRLGSAGAHAELLTLPGAGHGFKGEDAVKAERAAFAFFDRFLTAPVRHQRILVADHGPAGEVILMDWPSGRIHWKVPNQRGHDVQSLPGGNVLYTVGPARKVVEIDSNRNEVWSYGSNEGLEHPISAQRLPDGNTLIHDARKGETIEVTRDKKIVWRYSNPELANMQSRNARRTPQGTTLISVEVLGKIIEVDANGNIVWSFTPEGGARRRPYRGMRLVNGDTLVSMTDPGEVVQVARDGKIVRSFGGLQPKLRMGWASGTDLFTNGNLLINDYTGRRLIEVDSSGVIVNELRGPWNIASVSVVRE